MGSAISELASLHSTSFVVAAACICAISTAMLLALLRRARGAGTLDRLTWMTAIAVVGGLGVWTTHFVAMMGFRPPFAFGYDPGIVALSALVGILAIGCPLAAAALTRRRSLHALCGAVAGIGVAAMHVTGMNALQGCTVTSGPGATLLSTLIGSGLFAVAISISDRPRSKATVIGLIVLAVCSVHFVAMLGLSLESVAGFRRIGADQGMIGAVVVVMILFLLLMAALTAVSATRLDRQMKVGALLGAALANMSNGLIVIGSDGRVSLLNDRLFKLFGIGEGHVAVGMGWEEYLANLGSHLDWGAARTKRVIENHRSWFAKPDTTYLEHGLNDGRVISVACRPTAEGGAILTYDDITVEREAQKAFERLAFADPLTDLSNRRAFHRDLEASLTGGGGLALFLVDLDRFKSINDTLGHAVGDAVLVAIGRRLQEACSDGQTVYRLGGDELAILSQAAEDGPVDALTAAIMGTAAEPLILLGQAVAIGCSVGIATTADTRDGETLTQYADLALFKAKSRGGRQSRRYESGMLEAAAERRWLEANLRLALEGDQFTLLYQPLCRFPDRRVVGFEALVRWSHPERGFIAPDRFIPVAEETGQIVQIGDWVLSTACREAATWPADVHVAVNASPVQLRCQTFPLAIAKAMASSGLAPSRLCIELTETALVEDGDRIASSLQSLRRLGVKVAMDDFGTGYSSFAHLVDFDLDKIKIDRSFVQAAPDKPSARAVVKAVIQMAHDLGVETVGEGVETTEQLDLLQGLGCKDAQGYLLGRPLTAAAARERLNMSVPALAGDACPPATRRRDRYA